MDRRSRKTWRDQPRDKHLQNHDEGQRQPWRWSEFFITFCTGYSVLVQVFMVWLVILPTQGAAYLALFIMNLVLMPVFRSAQGALRTLVRSIVLRYYHLYSPPLPRELQYVDERS